MAGMLAFGTMSFIMSASPLAIVACGFPHAEAHWVIFMHVLGMFVPSFFTGNLINRFGATTVMAWGVALMLAGVVAALSGLSEWNFRIALTVNGVGWNFLFVGATTLVTTCYRPNERGKSQALNDLLVFSTTATSSFMAGFLQDRWGWQPLNWFSVLLMLAAAVRCLVASLPAPDVERCALRSSFLQFAGTTRVLFHRAEHHIERALDDRLQFLARRLRAGADGDGVDGGGGKLRQHDRIGAFR